MLIQAFIVQYLKMWPGLLQGFSPANENDWVGFGLGSAGPNSATQFSGEVDLASSARWHKVCSKASKASKSFARQHQEAVPDGTKCAAKPVRPVKASLDSIRKQCQMAQSVQLSF